MGTTGDFRSSGRANWLGKKDAWKGAPTVTRLAASAASSPARADYRCTSARLWTGTAKRDALGSPTTNRLRAWQGSISPESAPWCQSYRTELLEEEVSTTYHKGRYDTYLGTRKGALWTARSSPEKSRN